jgi:methylated-DNA-protein-cysteine methyltransferase-like protein
MISAPRERVPSASSYPRIYATVRRVPRGRVATYGQIAQLAGVAGQARLVGYAMFALPRTTTVPWHRVINAQGRISVRGDGGGAAIRQRILLEREGVAFDARDRVSIETFGWKPRALTSSGKSATRRRKRRPGR